MTSELLIILFGGLMVVAAVIDLVSFFVFKRHVKLQSVIVSLGMLGTFLGIVLGLWDFDTQKIVDSVPFLLEGLKLAFITSIMGIGLSVFWWVSLSGKYVFFVGWVERSETHQLYLNTCV